MLIMLTGFWCKSFQNSGFPTAQRVFSSIFHFLLFCTRVIISFSEYVSSLTLTFNPFKCLKCRLFHLTIFLDKLYFNNRILSCLFQYFLPSQLFDLKTKLQSLKLERTIIELRVPLLFFLFLRE